MRILHIITSLNIGGAEKLMVDLLPRLKEKGVDVEILLLVGKKTMFYEQLEKNGVKIHTFSEQGNVYNPKHLFSLYRFLKKNKFDIIHTHNTAPQIFAAIASILLPLKLVTTEHSTDNRRRDLRWYKIIDKWMYDRYSRVISISDAAHNNLISYLGIKNTTRKFSVVYNGVDVDKYANAVGTHANDSQKKIVTMVAGFRYQKDQDTLIKACSLLPKEDYELVKDADFVSARRTLIRDDTYRQCWAMPKKSQTVAITDDCDEPAIFVPKRNTRNSRMKCRAIQFA